MTGLTEADFDSYQEREKGYKLEKVDESKLSFYRESPDVPVLDDIYISIGTQSVPPSEIAPVPSYVRECVRGAFMHSDQFGMDFLWTTLKNPYPYTELS